MGLLKSFRMIMLVAIMLIAIFFVVKNPDQRVDINLMFFPTREGVLLVEVLFYSLLLGIALGYSIAALKIFELQAQVRGAKRSRHQLESELTALRNLPLDDADRALSEVDEP
jgi:uncharacterized membrane protein YciS (DUF1049 family)